MRPQRTCNWLFAIALLATHLGVANAGSAQAVTEGPAADSVRQAESERRQALLSSDTVSLSRLTGREFYEISRFGRVRTRAENMGEIASGALKLLTISYDSLSVRIYGDVAI